MCCDPEMLVTGVRLVWQKAELLGSVKRPPVPGSLGVKECLLSLDVVRKWLPAIILLEVDVSAGPLKKSCLSDSLNWWLRDDTQKPGGGFSR